MRDSVVGHSRHLPSYLLLLTDGASVLVWSGTLSSSEWWLCPPALALPCVQELWLRRL
jgi:hypothetical protein